MNKAEMKAEVEKAKQALATGPLSEADVKEIMKCVHNTSSRHYAAENILKRVKSMKEQVEIMSTDLCRWWKDSETDLATSPESVKEVLTSIRNTIWERLRSEWFEVLHSGFIIDLDADLPEDIGF